MKSLKFQHLVLVSDVMKAANKFSFHERFNLITSEKNSVGKSSLLKSLLWTVGCEPHFDASWKTLDIKAVLTFSAEGSTYVVARYKNIICFHNSKGYAGTFQKITGEWAAIFAHIVKFKAVLPSKKESDQLEVPPPAYYFTPFYIDQRRGWSEPFNNFSNLQMFSNWKRTVINSITGYLPDEHFSN